MDLENGLLNLAAIVGLIVICISTIPVLFLMAPGGEKGEPEDDAH